MLASTHGVQWYHPSPVDYWRWTHEGLRRLFTTNADWSGLEVEPSGGTAAWTGRPPSAVMPPFSGPQGPFAGIAAGPDGTLYVSADGEGSVLALRRDRS